MLGDRGGDARGERDTAALDPDEDEALGPGLPLDDLVGDADDRPADLVRGHDLACVHQAPRPGRPARSTRRDVARASSFPASRDRSLKGRAQSTAARGAR